MYFRLRSSTSSTTLQIYVFLKDNWSHTTLFPQLQFATPIAQWVKTKSTLLLKKSMGRWPFYTENVLVSVLNEHLSATRNLPKRFSPRYSGSQHADWISENLNCTRLLLQLGSICSHWRSVIWSALSLWTMYLLGRTQFLPWSSRSCFPMQEIVAPLLKWTWTRYLTKACYSFFNITGCRFEP